MDLNKIGYKMYLDDIRNPKMTYPQTLNTQWLIVRSYNEFVDTIEKKGVPTFISFDHDLGLEHYSYCNDANTRIQCGGNIPYETYKEKTGYDCAKWLVEYCQSNKIKFPYSQIHSMNPVGKENIRQYIESYLKTEE